MTVREPHFQDGGRDGTDTSPWRATLVTYGTALHGVAEVCPFPSSLNLVDAVSQGLRHLLQLRLHRTAACGTRSSELRGRGSLGL